MNYNKDQKNNATGQSKTRVFVNDTPTKCPVCEQVKTGYRGHKSKHYLFKFEGFEGLFCSAKCMRKHHNLCQATGCDNKAKHRARRVSGVNANYEPLYEYRQVCDYHADSRNVKHSQYGWEKVE